MAVFLDTQKTVGTTPVQLFPPASGSRTGAVTVRVQSDHSNSGTDVFVGTKASQSYRMKFGDWREVVVNDASDVWVRASAAGAVVNAQANGE